MYSVYVVKIRDTPIYRDPSATHHVNVNTPLVDSRGTSVSRQTGWEALCYSLLIGCRHILQERSYSNWHLITLIFLWNT